MRKRKGEFTQYKFLTREEEIEAWERGDYDSLVNSVWPFVLRTARKIAAEDSIVYDELLSAAGLTIANSLRTYDAHKARFITYACHYLEAKLANAAQRFADQSGGAVTEVTLDGLAAASTINPLELAEEQEQRAADVWLVRLYLREACTEAEFEVFEYRTEGETFTTIAARIGVTRQRAQQLFTAAKLKAHKLFPSLVESE
jgi:RNA polymerase sigma factor (sigma-70 family)